MKIATKGPLECVPSDRDALHAQSRGMNKESAAAMWAIQQKKKKKNRTKCVTIRNNRRTEKYLKFAEKFFRAKILSFSSSRLKGIRSYAPILLLFYPFSLSLNRTPTRISSIVKKFIDKREMLLLL